MKRFTLSFWVLLAIVSLFSQAALGVPTFQAYIDNGIPGTSGLDEDSWFTTSSSFDLIVVGAYSVGGAKATVNLTQVTLTLSVPKTEDGTISVSGGDGATLLTVKQAVPSTTYYNPDADADIDLLTNNGDSNDGYMTKSFLPEDKGKLLNNHYPFQDDVSNFLIYGIGDFNNVGPVNNYNAGDGGSITIGDGQGEEKTYSVSITGFSRVHFDVYGYNVYDDNTQVLEGTWDIAAHSHDSTYRTPAPGAILLGGIGVGLVGWLRRRKSF